jgi:DNA-binding PadR family transcriptional regulator
MAHPPEALGEFEQTVLIAIAHLKADAYGVTIRREIEARARRHVTVGALYTALDRLERKGYVRSKSSAPTPERGGRSKRYVSLTTAGVAALKRSRRMMDRMWAGLELDTLRGRP